MRNNRCLSALVALLIWVCGAAGLCGCRSAPKVRHGYWWDLYPSCGDSRVAAAEMRLKEECAESDSRKAVVTDLEATLRKPGVSLRDQYVAARVAASLLPYADVTDDMLRLLREEQRNVDFLGMLFFSRCMYSPEYIEYACQSLREHGTVPVRLLDHDGFCHARRPLMGLIITRGLRRASGEDFGPDGDAWLVWWRSKGSHMVYDATEVRYLPHP